MNHSLAKALMQAGIEHYDAGGTVVGASPGNTAANAVQMGTGAVLSPVQGVASGVAGALTTQNQYQAQNPYSTQVLQNSVNNLNNVNSQEQGLANQLESESQGQGPNPAQTMLQQSLQQQQGQAAAMAAGNRGINPGLAMRQALQAKGAAAANAQAQGIVAGQQQQLNAQNQLTGLYGQMGNQSLGQQGLYVNANNTTEGINAQIAQNNANAVNQTEGGILGGVGSFLGLAKGGKVPAHLDKMARVYHPHMYASGGNVFGNTPGGSIYVPGVPNFSNAKALDAKPSMFGGGGGAYSVSPMPLTSFGGAPGATDLGAMAPGTAIAARGGKIGGKAAVKGDSYKNDNVPALLSPGEVVLPRHVTQAKDAPSKAAEFMRSIQKKDNKKSDGRGYERVAKAKRRA